VYAYNLYFHHFLTSPNIGMDGLCGLNGEEESCMQGFSEEP